MPLLDIQQRMREVGRIRTGVQVPGKNGRMRPEKLATFRLTSRTPELIAAAAEVYGGQVAEWVNPSTGKEYEVVTTTDRIDVIVPPGQSLSQWYELWTAAGCARRCDGIQMANVDGPCQCPADPEDRRRQAALITPTACKPVTRLSLMLPALPDLGVWRLESHGFYAAVELAGLARILDLASSRGIMLPARLRLEQREKRIPGKPTNKYAVPVLEAPQLNVTALLPAVEGLPQIAPGPMANAGGKPLLPAGPELPATSDFRPTVDRVDDDDRPRTTSEPIDHVTVAPPENVTVAPPPNGTVDPAELPTPGWTYAEFNRTAITAGLTKARIYGAAGELWPGREQLELNEIRKWELGPSEWYGLALRLGLIPAEATA